MLRKHILNAFVHFVDLKVMVVQCFINIMIMFRLISFLMIGLDDGAVLDYLVLKHGSLTKGKYCFS